MCGCGCEQTIPTSGCNCSIIGKDNTTLSNVGNDIVVSSPFYDVVSPDDSIDVVTEYDSLTNTTTFNITKECCPDKLVGACDADTNPGTLFNDKLRVDTSGPLTYNLINCPGDAYVEIGFDESKLDVTDSKVAIDGSCPGKYLEDALTVNPLSAEYFELVKTLCELRLTPKPRQLFRFDTICNSETTYTLQANDTSFGFISSDKMEWVNSSEHDNNIGSLSSNLLTVTIPRTGWYQINMQGSYTSGLIHTVRNQICKVNGEALSTPLLDHRTEASWRHDLDSDDIINSQDELNNGVTESQHADLGSDDGEEMNIDYYLRGVGFSGARAVYLEEGEVLAMVVKYNTIVKNDYVVSTEANPFITFTSNQNDFSTNGRGAGTGRSVVELPKYTLTD